MENEQKQTSDLPEEVPTVDTQEIEKDIVSEIEEDLSTSGQDKQIGDGVAKPTETQTFDISKLSKAQLQTLKNLLDDTVDSSETKQVTPVVTLRKYDGKLIVSFGKAYLGLADDPINRRKIEKNFIPVKFLGEDNEIDIGYSEFMTSERVKCEVLNTSVEKERSVVGETFSLERKKMVEMVVVSEKTTFTIKLPNGETIDIDAKMVNA